MSYICRIAKLLLMIAIVDIYGIPSYTVYTPFTPGKRDLNVKIHLSPPISPKEAKEVAWASMWRLSSLQQNHRRHNV